MGKLIETGTMDIHTALGSRGTVYLDIPAGGWGEIRAVVSGASTHLRARCADGGSAEAGTEVRVVKILDSSSVEVERHGQEKGHRS